MKILKFMAIIIAFAMFISCGNSSESSKDLENALNELNKTLDEQTTDESITTTDNDVTVEEETKADESVDYKSKLIGEWEYIETESTVGSTTVNIKAVYAWILNFKEDGSYHESQTIAEGIAPAILDSKFSIEGKTLKREGAIDVDILDVDNNTLTIGSLGSKMKFKKK
ncbi:MAG: hypothetical protein DRI94_14885 [Bacteroidetes bacterium]|nr:MAG: hypothetical protein DRI94_14885 [Bacteroidota bacterium]